MSVRALRARPIVDPQTFQFLARTHEIHNQKIRQVIAVIFRMLHGKQGTNAEQKKLNRIIGYFIVGNSQNADYLLNAVSKTGSPWAPGAAHKYKAMVPAGKKQVEMLGSEWADKAAEYSRNGVRIFDKDSIEWFGCLPGSPIPQFVCCDAAAAISSHIELTANWRTEHEQWKKDREKWESEEEHKLYLKLRSRFEAFENEVGGKISKRRKRWHLYLGWLAQNADLAAWRHKDAKLKVLEVQTRERIAKLPLHKQQKLEFEEFWKLNPELKALDELHVQYEFEFVRRGKKRNPDGFKHRPTFTKPSADRHPRWFVFKRNDGYRNLQLPKEPGAIGTVDLKVAVGEESGKIVTKWISVSFKGDPRLSDFREVERASKRKASAKVKVGYLWYDRRLGLHDRTAEIKGIKLMFDRGIGGTLETARLMFTCEIKNENYSDLAKAVKDDFVDGEKGKKKFKGRTIPKGLVSLAVDIGIRRVGFATLARWDGEKIDLLRSRSIKLDSKETGSPDLSKLNRHKKHLGRLRSERGDPVGGEESHVQLQRHVTHMAEDRFKKAARAIVNLALNVSQDVDKKTHKPYPRADIIVLEHLGNLKPDASFERGVNKRIATFNHGHVNDHVDRLAGDVGLKVKKVYAYGTSQICHRCGRLGVRYAVERVAEGPGPGKRPAIRFGGTRPLFACEHCKAKLRADLPFTCNSDFNAAMNHQRRFYLGDDAVKDFGYDRAARVERLEAIEKHLEPLLRVLHGMSHPMSELPF